MQGLTSRNPAFWENESYYRRSLLRIMLWLMAAVACGLSLSNLSSHKDPLFILIEAFIGIYCLVFVVRLNRIRQLYAWTTTLLLIIFAIVTFGIASGAMLADGFYWLLLMPPMCLLFTGLLGGGILSALFGLIGMWVLADTQRLADNTINIPLSVNAAVCYISIWAMSHVYEYRRIKVARTLRDVASRDPLTGIYNRLQLENVFSQLLRQYRQTQQTFSLLLLDIDHFKRLNDQFGHAAGDHVLKELAARLKQASEQADWRFRVGGEEFCILLPDCNALNAHDIAEKMRNNIAQQPISFHEQQLSITISIGIAEWQPHVKNFDEFYRLADHRLYGAKRAGRNQTVSNDEKAQVA